MLSSCANCEVGLNPLVTSDSFNLKEGNAIDSNPVLTAVTVSSSVSLIFGSNNCCQQDAGPIRLCPDCILVLAHLYKFYKRFKGLTSRTSELHWILSDKCRSECPRNNPTLDSTGTSTEAVQHLAPSQFSVMHYELNKAEESDEFILPNTMDDDFDLDSEDTEKYIESPVSSRLRSRKETTKTPILKPSKQTPEHIGITGSTVIPSMHSKKSRLSNSNIHAIQRIQTRSSTKSRVANEAREREKEVGSLSSKTLSNGDGLDVNQKETGSFVCKQSPTPQNFESALMVDNTAMDPQDGPNQSQEKEKRECHHGCEGEFTSDRRLKSHLKRIHNEAIRFACKFCPKTFSRRNGRTEHMKTSHFGYSLQDEEMNTCPVCKKFYPSQSRLRAHLTKIHNANKAVECQICKKVFYYTLEMHMRLHDDEIQSQIPKKLPCPHCEKSFKHKRSLRQHVDFVHLQKFKYVCEICGLKPSSSTALRHHMETHDPNREKKYPCDICHKLFSSYSLQKRHSLAHVPIEERKGCVCIYCGMRVSKPGKMSRHLKVRHRDLPEIAAKAKSHQCHICGKEFPIRDYLRQHLRSKDHDGVGHYRTNKLRVRDSAEIKA